MKLDLGMKTLQILQGQFTGFHISVLKTSRELTCLILKAICSQILGLRYEANSLQLKTL